MKKKINPNFGYWKNEADDNEAIANLQNQINQNANELETLLSPQNSSFYDSVTTVLSNYMTNAGGFGWLTISKVPNSITTKTKLIYQIGGDKLYSWSKNNSIVLDNDLTVKNVFSSNPNGITVTVNKESGVSINFANGINPNMTFRIKLNVTLFSTTNNNYNNIALIYNNNQPLLNITTFNYFPNPNAFKCEMAGATLWANNFVYQAHTSYGTSQFNAEMLVTPIQNAPSVQATINFGLGFENFYQYWQLNSIELTIEEL